MTTTNSTTRMRTGSAALWRSAVSAFGITIGALLAIPVGGYAVQLLFDTVGERVADSVISEGVGDASGFTAVIVAICLVLAGVVLAVLVVLALAAPIFVVLPLAAQGVALWVAGAGLVWRTIGGTVLLAVAAAFLAQLVPAVRESGPMIRFGASWVPAVGFLVRLFVEWRWPDRARVRAQGIVDRGLRRLLWGWLWLAVAALIGLLAFALIDLAVRA